MQEHYDRYLPDYCKEEPGMCPLKMDKIKHELAVLGLMDDEEAREWLLKVYSLSHIKTPPLWNLCLESCHVIVSEWRPRQQCFFP